MFSMHQGHPYHPDNETIMVKMVLILNHSMNKDQEHFTTRRYELDLSHGYTTTQEYTTQKKRFVSDIASERPLIQDYGLAMT